LYHGDSQATGVAMGVLSRVEDECSRPLSLADGDGERGGGD
jgi:hypothetical protein